MSFVTRDWKSFRSGDYLRGTPNGPRNLRGDVTLIIASIRTHRPRVIVVKFVGIARLFHWQIELMKIYIGKILKTICAPFQIHCGKYLVSVAAPLATTILAGISWRIFVIYSDIPLVTLFWNGLITRIQCYIAERSVQVTCLAHPFIHTTLSHTLALMAIFSLHIRGVHILNAQCIWIITQITLS